MGKGNKQKNVSINKHCFLFILFNFIFIVLKHLQQILAVFAAHSSDMYLKFPTSALTQPSVQLFFLFFFFKFPQK